MRRHTIATRCLISQLTRCERSCQAGVQDERQCDLQEMGYRGIAHCMSISPAGKGHVVSDRIARRRRAMADQSIALMAHLMRRAGFGAPYAELETRAAKGYEATVEELLHPEQQPELDQDIMLR